MQSAVLPVCNMDLFGKGIRHFYADTLSTVLERFPQLEFPHTQRFYMLLCIQTASGELLVDEQKIRLDSPKVIIIKPRCITSLDINRQAKGFLICFTEDFFSLRYNDNVLYQFSFLRPGAKPALRLSEKQSERWFVLLSLLVQEFGLQKMESSKVLRSYLNILLFELERLYQPIGMQPPRKNEKLLQFENLIDKHFAEKKLPSAYAELLHVSPNYLNKLCKDDTGYTAGELIRKRIILEAKRLLHFTRLTVSEIADKLGFESSSYFGTFFRKHTDMTPEHFRKNKE